MTTSPIIIIGAGVGGLSAAIRLAAAGQRVVVLEQNTTVGGKMGEVTAAGFRWDTGPSVITMRHVFTDLFATAGRRLEDCTSGGGLGRVTGGASGGIVVRTDAPAPRR